MVNIWIPLTKYYAYVQYPVRSVFNKKTWFKTAIYGALSRFKWNENYFSTKKMKRANLLIYINDDWSVRDFIFLAALPPSKTYRSADFLWSHNLYHTVTFLNKWQGIYVCIWTEIFRICIRCLARVCWIFVLSLEGSVKDFQCIW